jgi:hypothetical protein
MVPCPAHVDRWLSDNIKAERWERIAGAFPHGNKHSPNQQWVIMTEDTKTPSPYRYQQYGITVKLNPDNTDKLHATFLSLPKTYPTLWICCGHHDCMVVYDVTNTCDTQRNIHLAEHHSLGVKAGHGHTALRTTRHVTLAQRNADADSRNREQPASDWVACCRDTMRGTIDECFLVPAEQVKVALRPVLKRSVFTLVHLNADLWTSKVSHQKFLVVRIFWKSGPELKTALLAVTLYAPPKKEDKQASEWLIEYVLTVLKWYGVEPKHVKGATSDAGSECKKAFHKLAREHGWM